MPSIKRYCAFPRCTGRTAANGFRGRRIQSKYKITITGYLYEEFLLHSNGGPFSHEECDEICPKCEVAARSNARTKVDGKWVSKKRRSMSQSTIDESLAQSSSPPTSEESDFSEVMAVSLDMEGSEVTAISETNSHPLSSQATLNSFPNSTGSQATSSDTYSQWSCSNEKYSSRAIHQGAVPFCLPGISAMKYTERCCFICSSLNGRSRVPYLAILDVWIHRRIFVPAKNRCCKSHLSHGIFTVEALNNIEANKSYAEVTGLEMAKWMMAVTDQLLIARNFLDFEPTSRLKDSDFDMLLGVTKDQFEMLFAYVEPTLRNSKLRSRRSALAVVLMKLRLNMSQRVLAFLFTLPHQSYVSKILKKLVKELNLTFVPENVGYQHTTREKLMSDHMRNFYSKILELPPTACIFILDGTYLPVEKSTIHKTQRKSFCTYKTRNVVKPMMVVAPDGLIVAVEGLYFSDFSNNDSNILKDMLSKDSSIMSVLEAGDALLLDRGFQSALQDAESHGLKTFMPALLAKKQQQFTTNEANTSRRVTVLRYIVELANGRIKNKFRFFDDTIPVPYFPLLKEMFLLGCAMLNKFTSSLVRDSTFHEKVADEIEKRMDKPNLLQAKVEEQKWDKRRIIWEQANHDCALGFPELSLEDLKEITLGEYQLKMGNNYNEEHLSVDETYVFCTHTEQLGIIRVQLRSRYSSRTTRTLWIEFREHVNGREGILEWYCKCPIGARTVGCCSHIAAVLRYLGHDRFIERPKRKDTSHCFLDAAANLASLMESSDSESEFEEEDDEEELLDV